MKGGEKVAQNNHHDDLNQDFVDISSSSEVNRVYHPSAAARGARDARKPTGKAKKRTKLTLRIVALVLSIVFLIAGSVVIYAFYFVMPKYKALSNDPKWDVKPTSASDGGSATISEANDNIDYQITQDSSTLLQHDKVLNILLFGQDYSGSSEDHGRSDTMILLSIDNLHKKIKLCSFQRDTYVYIPGYGDDKINAAFSLGGEGLAIKTLEMNFGIKVDKYATVDFDSFRKIIKVLGGIDMELNLEEIEYINAQIDVNNQLGKTSFIEYDPTKELQTIHLDGYQALWYARDRGEENLGGNPQYSFSGDDWDRTERQRKLIETIIKYLRTKASLGELISIVNDVGPMITTNLKKDHILFLARHMMTYIGYDMVQLSLPTDGAWRYDSSPDGQSIIFIDDWNKVKRDMASFIYEDAVVTKKQ